MTDNNITTLPTVDVAEPNATLSVMEALAPIKQQNAAFEALKESPLSFRTLRELCHALVNGDWLEKDSLDGTLAFIRSRKLPKGKTVSWLAKQGISSDREIIFQLWIPLLAQMAPYYVRMAESKPSPKN